MAKSSKRMQEISQQVEANKHYLIHEAVELLNKLPAARFKESFDMAVRLGVDVRMSDQVVRGSVSLPNSIDKAVRVAVFAEGDLAEEARKAGADIVGAADLVEQIKAGNLDFDVAIATPAAMQMVAALGQILGPKGLMPNPKMGTVATAVGQAVANVKAGQMQYRTDRSGVIHGSIGQVGFKPELVKENMEAVLVDLKKHRPASTKGIYFQKITLSTTMGPGLVIDQASLEF